MIENNDPDNAWGHHTVQLVFKEYEFSKTYTVKVGGNCHGFDVIETAIGQVVDILADNLEDKDGPLMMSLEHPTKGTRVAVDEEENEEDWLKNLLVSAVILSYTPKAK